MSTTLSATATAPSALPETLPIFPLSGVVLLPRAKLPLNIFEPRYLAMLDDVLATPGRMIGMIQPKVAEGDNNPVPPVYNVGCAGRVVSFNEMEDGRFLIGLTGLCRFEVAEELTSDKPYRSVQADWTSFLSDLDPSPAISIQRQHLHNLLQHYFKQQKIDIDWTAVEKTPDELLISSLVMICPLAANERQALLEAPNLAARASMLIALLEMASSSGPGESEGGARH